MTIVRLVSSYPSEVEARVACAEFGRTDLPYRGVWVHPTPDRPLVHIFSDLDDGDLAAAEWVRPSSTEEPPSEDEDT